MSESWFVRSLVCLSFCLLMACSEGNDTVSQDQSQEAPVWTQVSPQGAIRFPGDHGEHPQYQLEWWYLTANLTDADGEEYGAQWTLFRFALRPPQAATAEHPWQSPQVYLGHCALSHRDWHLAAERYARGGVGLAEVHSNPLRARIENWTLQSTVSADEADPFRAARAFCEDAGHFALDLRIVNTGPLVKHGRDGFSQKHPDPRHASWYYSAPFLQMQGVISKQGRDIPVQGTGWFDHEWTSALLSDDQVGWDWGSLSFENGQRLMVFRVRGRDGEDFYSGSLISPSGEVVTLSAADFILEPLEERSPSRSWRVAVPKNGIDVRLQSYGENHWMELTTRYWESPVHIDGTHQGRGFFEMTGY